MTGATGGQPNGRAVKYTTTVTVDKQGRTHVPVPFDPDDTWAPKSRHHITGTVDGRGVRGVITTEGDSYGLVLGPVWARDDRPITGAPVEVVLEPEGPQRGDLAPDVAAALDVAPDAAAFFDSLAQFYRNAYLRWIDATKRRPDQRPVRIAEMIRLLREGKKQRP